MENSLIFCAQEAPDKLEWLRLKLWLVAPGLSVQAGAMRGMQELSALVVMPGSARPGVYRMMHVATHRQDRYWDWASMAERNVCSDNNQVKKESM